MTADNQLSAFLDGEKDTLQTMAKSARDKDEPGFIAAAGGLLVAGATGLPFIGPLVSEGVKQVRGRGFHL